MTQTAKDALIHDLEENVGEFLTYKHTKLVSEALGGVLVNYDVEQKFEGEASLDLLQEYLSAMSVEGKSPKTISSYYYVISKMIRTIGKPVEAITTADVREYLAGQKQEGVSDRALEGARSYASSFFKWLLRERLIKANPIESIGSIKYKKEVKIPFSNAEMERIKRSCKDTKELTIVNFLRCTGCRISEVVKLNKDDINLMDRTLIVCGKGNKERRVFIDDITAELLQEYASERKDNSPALFPSNRSERMTDRGFQKLLERIGARAKVEHVHPHRFRRTLATHLSDMGWTLQEIAELLGHEDINTTRMYVTVKTETIEGKYRRCM